MAEPPRHAVPRPIRCDITRLAIDSTDAFLLAQIDGHSSIDDLATVSGLAVRDVQRIVARLEDAGAVEVPGPPSRRKSEAAMAAPRRTMAPAASRRTMAPAAPRRTRRSIAPTAPRRSLGANLKVGTSGTSDIRSSPGSGSMAPASRRAPASSRAGAAEDATLVPRVVDRAAVRGHAVDAREAFVLAQVDGKTPVEDLASVTGLSVSEVMKILAPLTEAAAIVLESSRGAQRSRPLGAVTEMTRIRRRSSAPPASARPRRSTVAPPSSSKPPRGSRTRSPTLAPPASRARAPTLAPPPSARPRRPTAAPPGPASVRRPSRKSVRAPAVTADKTKVHAGRKAPEDDVCELDAELTARIDGLLQRPENATLYDLLGVPRNAPKKAIKRAYFELAATLHPDRHFRKRLGPYKVKLHDLFVLLTSAHDRLVDQAMRASYDATLPPEPRPPTERPPRSRRSVQPAPRYLSLPPLPPVAAPAARRKTTQVEMPRVAVVPPAGPDRAPPVSLRSEGPPLAEGPLSGPVPSAAPLKRFFAEKVGKSARERANVFVDAAETALRAGNLVSAAQNYALAVQACNAPELQAALADVTERARVQTSERALKAAVAAEKLASWDEAVLRYGKAYEVLPTASVAERLAHSLRMQGSDLRRAVKVAEDAVLREPNNVVCRVTLGFACLDAGLAARAKGESQRALAAAPRDPGALELAARVKEGER